MSKPSMAFEHAPLWFGACLVLMLLAACSPHRADRQQVREPIFIMLTRGIEAGLGLLPPTRPYSPDVSHVCYLDSTMQDPLAARSYYEPSGYNRYDSCELHREQLLSLIQSLDDFDFWDLPVGDSGSNADIYGLGIQLSVQSGDRTWRNPVTSGCVIRLSRIRPSDSERQRFEDVIWRVDSMFMAASCTTEVDKYAFGEIMFRGREFAHQRGSFREMLNRRKRNDALDTLHP